MNKFKIITTNNSARTTHGKRTAIGEGPDDTSSKSVSGCADSKTKAPFAVVSSSDLLDSPESFLRNLCSSLDIGFNKKMLSWPRGPHPDDGVWGRVWYENTNKSTCFIQQTNKEILLSDYQKSIVDSAYTYYKKLESFKQESL